jgi:HK97 family phage major capsid protein
MNEVILALHKRLDNMKANLPSEAATVEQINKYFLEQQEITEQMLKILGDTEDATTSEIMGCKDAIKNFREAMKQADTKMEQLSLRDVEYNLGKALCAAWNKDHETLGKLKFCPNIRAEKWNNPKDFSWETGKGFVPSKAVLGEPIGNLANNDQYLINPIYEETIMQEVAKQSQMMNLVTHRPMNGPSIFIPERDRGGIELKWLTSYGQKIDATKSNMPTRTELKAYTLAGYVPFFDEFGEDVFVDLGKMFLEDFTEAYGQEFDRQCLIADADPFTGAINMANAEKHAISGTDVTSLTYLDFRAAELKVEPEERKYCKWFLNETVLNHVANIQDDNHNPIWRKPGDGMPGRIDGYDVVESRLMPQLADIEADNVIAIFMNPKRIIHGNRKGIEIKRFDETTESLEYGELFMRFRKRDGFLVTRPAKNMVLLKTAEE